MLVMVPDGTFHKTYERGLLGNVPQNKKNNKFRTASPYSRVEINTER